MGPPGWEPAPGKGDSKRRAEAFLLSAMAPVAPLDRQGFPGCALLGPIPEPRLQPSELDEARDKSGVFHFIMLPSDPNAHCMLGTCSKLCLVSLPTGY